LKAVLPNPGKRIFRLRVLFLLQNAFKNGKSVAFQHGTKNSVTQIDGQTFRLRFANVGILINNMAIIQY